MKNIKKIRPLTGVAGLSLLGLLMLPVAVAATTLLSQGFFAPSNLPAGSIVSLQDNSTDHVVAATTSNSDNILGVVINSDNSQVSLTSDGNNQVQVSTSGVEQVLVSDINGNISGGDPITGSPINGVGMKATANAKIIGVAQGNFPNSTASKQSYTDKSGQKQDVTLGEVPVLVNVAYFYKQPTKTLIPQTIQNLANALAGKPVNSLPIIVSMAIFLIMLIVVVSIIYAMIHSSIISVGRNPMSQSAIYRNVIQLSGLVVVILMVSVAAIYMVLTKF